jgi:hypothetical protein
MEEKYSVGQNALVVKVKDGNLVGTSSPRIITKVHKHTVVVNTAPEDKFYIKSGRCANGYYEPDWILITATSHPQLWGQAILMQTRSENRAAIRGLALQASDADLASIVNLLRTYKLL